MESVSKHNVVMLGLRKIDTNMALASNEKEIKYAIRAKWKTHKVEAGTCIGEKHETHLQGGTLIAAAERYVNRIRDSHQDPHRVGFFSYVEMEGKGESKILVISCYRPCRGSNTGGKGHTDQSVRIDA